MGYPTDFIGHLEVTPPLNPAEAGYLAAFSRSRRWDRPGGPYDVGAAPQIDGAVDGDDGVELGRAFHRPPLGQPGLWCDWEPCWDGCCLAHTGAERFAGAVEWLRYLVAHFLGRGAAAARSGLPVFAGFTFDHVLDGMVLGCRRDNKELFAITVTGNRVREEVLRRADRRCLGRPPLPYEVAADRALGPQALLRRERQGSAMPYLQRPAS